MLRDLLPYFGYDVNQIPENAEIFFVLNNAPKSWLAFVFFAVLLTILFVVYKLNRKEHDVCPDRIKKFLGFLRVTVFIFISLIFLDPALGISIKKMLEPQILILVDNSASMNIKDKYLSQDSKKNVYPYLGKADSASRLDLLKLAVKQYSIDDSLSQKGAVHIYSFDKNLNDEFNNKKLTEVINLLPGDKPNTDITSSLKSAVHLYNGKKVAGVIIITDGKANTGAPLNELTQYMVNQKIPIFSIGVGNSEKSKNIKISELWLPDRVFKDDPFIIQTKIAGSQMQGESVDLQLIEIPLNDQGEPMPDNFKLVDQKQIVFKNEEQEQTISFEYKAEKEGKFIYKVKVETLVGEAISIDNEKESQTEILSKSARVLLVAGTSTWDYRMLQTLLVRDKTINVSCWLQSMDIDMLQDGKTPINKLPDNESDLFAYDVIILMDPNPIELDEKWMVLLQKFVEERKGGLMFIAGPNYTSKTLSMLGTSKLKDLLPVQFTEMQREHKDFMKVTYETQWPFHLTAEGQSHYIGKLNGNNNVNKEIWKSLPGIYWSYPVGESKAGSKVLLEHTDPKLLFKEKNRPLLVTGIFGSGRTLYMGFNGVWRWRKNSDKYFDKFWIQSIRYLIEGKLEKDSGKSNLYTNKEKFLVGETISVSAKIYDDIGQPYFNEKLIGKVFKGTNVIGEVLLRPEINRKGFYEGELKAEMQGDLNLSLEISDIPNLKLDRSIKVEQPIIEFENAEMNYLELKSLSEKTKGNFYHLSNMEGVIKDFPNLKEKLVVNLPPDSLWDTGRFFIIIICLLTLEWTIRKKYKLL